MSSHPSRNRPVSRPPSYEVLRSPEEIPTYSLVPVAGPRGNVLDSYRGVQRDDTHEIVSVVSSRYGLVAHREVARVVCRVGAALEPPDLGSLPHPFPRESIRLYHHGRRLELKLVVGRKYHLEGGEELYPGLRVLNSLDGSWAIRLSGFAVRLACANQLYAQSGNVLEWRELHLSSETDLLADLGSAIRAYLERFPEGFSLYRQAMREEMLAEDVGPSLAREGIPTKHARSIGGRAEAEASHVGMLSRWAAYQVATAYLTREVRVNPDRERQFERMTARALLQAA